MSSTQKPLLPLDIDSTKLSFNLPLENKDKKVGSKGIKYGFAAYDGGQCRFQTPSMITPFGISFDKDENTDQLISLKLNFSFDGTNRHVVGLLKKMEEFDDKVFEFAVNNSKTLFGMKKEAAELKPLFKSNIKFAIDKETGKQTDKYAPTLRCKIPYNKDKNEIDPATEIYRLNDDGTREKMNVLDEMGEATQVKGATCTAVIHFVGFWYSKSTGFGTSYKIKLLQVKPPAPSLKNYQMVDLNDMEDEQKPNISNYQMDSDDD